MSAIYQRARPIRWDQVVGQEHVKDVLKAALEQGRVGHAYLFSGPRGVGKTTTARLIAMTANCVTPGIKPCGECESCLSVRAGNHPDVLEIDAASNNSVDDVRELREKVGLSAMRGGKKIYILDEAHMMTRSAFNALLKTLEEPPSHVIFILATTEPEKIIPTILSRCQHYRFRRLTPQEVAGKLAGIAQNEGVRAEPEALNLIGRLADGAMRDGESLLERMLAAGQDVTRAGVEAALGLPPGEQMRSMAGALVQNDAAGLLEGAASLYRAGYAARTVVDGLVTALGEALHAELGLSDTAAARLEGADVPRLLRLQAALDAQDSRFARGADQQSLELALTHALIAGEGVQAAGPVSGGAGVPAEVGQRLARLEKEFRDLKASGVPVQTVSAPPRPAIHDEIPALDDAGRAPPRPNAPVAVAPPAGGGTWADVLKLASSQLRAFLKPARMHAQQGYASLTYDDKGSFHAKQVISKFDDLGQLVVRVFGPVMLEIIGPAPDSSRKMQVGGKGGAGAAPVPATPLPSSPTPAQRPLATPALDDIPPFAEARAERAAPALSPAAEIPEFTPSRAPSGRASAAPPKRAVSLDDRAAAPLPEVAPHAPQHVADVPPLPDGAGLPASEAPARDTGRATYLAPEPIFQEPDWDDLGGMPDAMLDALPPLPSAQATPAAVVSAPPVRTPPETAAPVPSPRSQPATPPLSAAARAELADLRAHPLYQEATKMWSGRVREVGKVKLKVQEDSAAEAEVPAEEESA